MTDFQAFAIPTLLGVLLLVGGLLIGWALRQRHDNVEREWNMTHAQAWRGMPNFGQQWADGRDHSDEPTGV